MSKDSPVTIHDVSILIKEWLTLRTPKIIFYSVSKPSQRIEFFYSFNSSTFFVYTGTAFLFERRFSGTLEHCSDIEHVFQHVLGLVAKHFNTSVFSSSFKITSDSKVNEAIMVEIFDSLSVDKPILRRYQEEALLTESSFSNPVNPRLRHGLIGIATESGELLDLIKRIEYYGASIDLKVEITKELGDLLWYINLTASAIGVPLEVIMETNLAKLRARYKDKFTSDRALNRNTTEEDIAALEAMMKIDPFDLPSKPLEVTRGSLDDDLGTGEG